MERDSFFIFSDQGIPYLAVPSLGCEAEISGTNNLYLSRFFWLRKSRLGVQPIICWIGLYITRPAERDRSGCSGAMLILCHTVRGVLYSEAIRAITLFFYIHIISTVGAGWFYVGDSHVLRKYGSDGPRRGNCAAT